MSKETKNTQRHNCSMEKIRSLRNVLSNPDLIKQSRVPLPKQLLRNQQSFSSFKNLLVNQMKTMENKSLSEIQCLNSMMVANNNISSRCSSKNSRKCQHRIQSVQKKLQVISSKLDRFTLRVQCIQKNMKSNLQNFSDQIFKYLQEKYSAKVIDQKIKERTKIMAIQIEDIKAQLNSSVKIFDNKLSQDQQFLKEIQKLQKQMAEQFSQNIENVVGFNKNIVERLQQVQKKLLDINQLSKPISLIQSFSCKSALSQTDKNIDVKVFKLIQKKQQFQNLKPESKIISQKRPNPKYLCEGKKIEEGKIFSISEVEARTDSSCEQSDRSQVQFTFSLEAQQESISNCKQLNATVLFDQNQADSVLYYIDEDKHLMDENGYYIQDQNGNPIVLSYQQQKQLQKLLILGCNSSVSDKKDTKINNL